MRCVSAGNLAWLYIHVSVNIYGPSQFVVFSNDTAVQEASINQSIVYYRTINFRQPQYHWLFVLLFTIQ